jgi:hypothetical protein
MIVRVQSCVMAVLLVAAAAYVQAQTSASRADVAGVAYAAGGIGLEDRQRLAAREKDFNLKLVFTLTEGNYLSDVEVAVKDASGKALLTLPPSGPIILVKLPRGAHVVQASYEGKTQTRKINIAERLHTEHLRWPSNPGTDTPAR